MFKTKWIPLSEDEHLGESAIVTRIINDNQRDVTIGLPGWGLQNKTIAYMLLPPDAIEKPELWKSEYRGDELPKSGVYITCLQNINEKRRPEIMCLYLNSKTARWTAVPLGWEVVAWMSLPKPYKG